MYSDVEWGGFCSALYKTYILNQVNSSVKLHNYLNVNEKSYRWKLAESRLCSYCFTEVESLAHLFCYCYIVKMFHFQIMEWAAELDAHLPYMYIYISELIVVYGNIEESDNWYLIGHLISLYKQLFLITEIKVLGILKHSSYICVWYKKI